MAKQTNKAKHNKNKFFLKILRPFFGGAIGY